MTYMPFAYEWTESGLFFFISNGQTGFSRQAHFEFDITELQKKQKVGRN